MDGSPVGSVRGGAMSNVFLTPNFDNIPLELRSHPFVNWRAEGPPDQKLRKVPYIAGSLNSRASSTDPATWRTFEQATAGYLQGGFTGIGIVLDGSGLVGVDSRCVDRCLGREIPLTEYFQYSSHSTDYIQNTSAVAR